MRELIESAHRKNIAVIPWFEFGFATAYNDPSGGIILEKKPQWKAMDRDGKLVSKNNFQWMNGFDPEVQDFMMSLIMEVVKNYDIEGVQGDDRLPAMPSIAGYDNYTSSLYRAKYNTDPPYDYYNAQWVDFRADLMNQFMERMRNEIKNFNKVNNKHIMLAMSPSIFPWCKEEYLQDWPTWLQNNWVDYLFPQVYRYSLEAYTKTLDENALNYVPEKDLYKFYPGILIKLGEWDIDQAFLEGIFKVNRERGINGEVFFYYEALKNPTIQKVIEDEYRKQPTDLSATPVFAQENPKPIRGAWVTISASTALDSEQNIIDTVNLCAKSNLNTICVAMWDQSMTNYPSQIMKNLTGVEINPRFAGRDPLKEIIQHAHAKNIKVIAWFEYGFATSYNNPTGGPILQAKPAWKAIDNQGNLVTENNFQWMNGFNPEVQDFMISLFMEVASRYDIDGIQGDDRCPAMPKAAGYDSYTVNLYKQSHSGQAPPSNNLDPDWIRWRADLLNNFMENISIQMKKQYPNVLVTMAPSVYPWSLTNYLQDWPTWVQKNWVDYIFPQVYRYTLTNYQSCMNDIINDQVSQENLYKFYPGIVIQVGTAIKNVDTLQSFLDYNSAHGINGAVFFFFEGLKNSTIQGIIENEYGNLQ